METETLSINKEITDLVNLPAETQAAQRQAGETCYKQYINKMPKTVRLIQRFINEGIKPKTIHKYLVERYGACEISQHLGCVADYLYDQIKK